MRVAAKVVSETLCHSAELTVEHEGATASGRSITQLVLLGASFGTWLIVTASGQDAEILIAITQRILEGGL